MRRVVAAAGGLISTAVAAGTPIFIALAVLILVMVGVLCWIVANSGRTINTVALITATRPTARTGDARTNTRQRKKGLRQRT
jgi:hypothetical protein